ncbi:MAG: glycosyl transferase group 1 [Thermoleophilia bacterium]|nr:glycosyl transferase group 1 [Thermoleophilia bacterium]
MSLSIAMVSEHASPLATLGGVDAGGQNIYVANVARALARRGHAIDIYTRREDAALPEVATWAPGVRLIQVPAGPEVVLPKEQLMPLMPAFAEFMRGFWRREGEVRPDLVHANFFMSGMVAQELRRREDMPFVITFHALGRVRRQHQGADDHFPPARECAEASIVADADRLIAECPVEREQLVQLYGADAESIDLVPAGVDLGEFWPVGTELARASLGLPSGCRIALQVGRMVPRKGVDDAIRGFASYRASATDDARLLVVGGSAREPDLNNEPELARLHAVAEEEGVGEAVVFLGSRRRDELRLLYGAADAFITTPWYEPFGITPLEAMACGTPVIGADVGGISWTVRHGETGLLVPPHAPDAIGAALTNLFADEGRRLAMAASAVRHVASGFTWEHVADGLEASYRRTLDAVPPPESSDVVGLVAQVFSESSATLAQASLLRHDVADAATLLVDRLASGARVFMCGNGGSAADAQHFVAELVGRFNRDDRRALPAMALTADSAVLTAWANDFGFEHVFARQLQAHARPGDLLVAISTSGTSPNVLRALETAHEMRMVSIVLTGADGTAAAAEADVAICVPSAHTPRIQEVHGVVIHALCSIVDSAIGPARSSARPSERRTHDPRITAPQQRSVGVQHRHQEETQWFPE